MSLIDDGLAHVSFGAIALGLFFGIYPFYIAIPVVILASTLILKISEKARLYGDASIGIVSAVGIATGVILLSLSHGFNVNLFNYLFGNILIISTNELILSAFLFTSVCLMIYLFYWDLFSNTFDEAYAKTTGIKTNFINYLLTVFTALTVVLSIKVVGVMLVSAFLILPAVTAIQIAREFKTVMIFGALFSLTSVIAGVVFSFSLDLPAGAVIVIINALLFTLIFTYKRII